MHFHKLDLNLLVAFNALCKERNITRAAAQLHMSQSAMSHALRRLRDYFDDELLVPVGRGLELTPHAQMLEETVTDLLSRLKVTLESRPEFDPGSSDRTFTISASDYSLAVLVPKMLSLARQQDSKVRFRLAPQIQHPDRPLDSGEVDLVVFPLMHCSPLHPSVQLWDERIVCVVWNQSPLAKTEITLDRYLSAGHIGVQTAEIYEIAFEAAISKALGSERRVEVVTYSFATMPNLVVGTDYVATLQRRLAIAEATHLPIVIHELPLPLPEMSQAMQWHRHRTNDPGLRWVRALVQKAALLTSET